MEIISKISNDGKIEFSEKNNNDIYSFLLKNTGKDISIKYDIIKDIKSYEQLKFYFGVIIQAFVQATGDTNKSMFDAYLRDKYLSSIHEINGEQFKYIPTLQISKNKISKEKMSEFIQNCINELIDLGGSIDRVEYENYMRSIW